jgi:arginyl-tRNA synthetase
MQSIIGRLKHILAEAVRSTLPIEEVPVITPGTSKTPGDFVSPVALSIFNRYKKEGCFGYSNAFQLANTISQHLPASDIVERIEVAQNGFMNIFIQNAFVINTLTGLVRTNSVEVNLQSTPCKILVDFSSPNIAKEMHVGHLRSTIIGDAICKCLEYLGHDVLRVNHLGDWGTQFGMLLCYLLEEYPDWESNPPDISNLEAFYKAAKKRFDSDEDFKTRSRLKVVDLQSGNEEAVKIWKFICKVSRDYLQIIYDRLGITIQDCGESFYNSMLPGLVEELREQGYITESDGALIFPLSGHTVPLMAQKSDGGYGYDSTDLAAAKYRLLTLGAKRVIYVTDVGQAPHFYMIFDAAKLVGWHRPPETRMDHAGFGVVLGPDGKKFKTRTGEAIKLSDLLDEAKSRALQQLTKRSEDQGMGQTTHLDQEQFEEAAELMGTAAIKYYDLRQNRISTYAFAFDKMLDPRGNTAVYLIYAYARICSILTKAGSEAVERGVNSELQITTPHERALALLLCRFPDILETVVDELALNKVCDLLYEISVKYSEFYNACKVIDSPEQDSRLQLCLATKLMMFKLFHLLGIKPLEKI